MLSSMKTQGIPSALFAILSIVANADAARFDCGQPYSNGALPTVVDALVTLQAAVGRFTDCEHRHCACDVDHSETLRTSDALLILRAAVGQPVPLDCWCITYPDYFSISSGNVCDNAVIEIDYGSIPLRVAHDLEGRPRCQIDPRRTAEGCSIEVEEDATGLQISLPNCPIWDTTAIASCHFEVGDPFSILDAATARCECVEEACDTTPPVCIGEHLVICN
jgi:hypothetical protein